MVGLLSRGGWRPDWELTIGALTVSGWALGATIGEAVNDEAVGNEALVWPATETPDGCEAWGQLGLALAGV